VQYKVEDCLEGAVFAAANDEARVGGPADLVDRTHVPSEGAHKSALHPIPELDGFVEGSADQIPPIRGKLDLQRK